MGVIEAIAAIFSAIGAVGKGVEAGISGALMQEAMKKIGDMKEKLANRSQEIKEMLSTTRYSRAIEDLDKSINEQTATLGSKLTDARGVVTALSSTYGVNLGKIVDYGKLMRSRMTEDYTREMTLGRELFEKQKEISKTEQAANISQAKAASESAMWSSLFGAGGTAAGLAYNWKDIWGTKPKTETISGEPKTTEFQYIG